MLLIRDSVFMILLVTALIMISCSWSTSQQEILDAYNEAAGYIDRNEWESAAGSMSSSTMLFLDSLSSNLSARGLQGYGSAADLLPILCREYIDFSGDVTMIFVQGDQAEITLSSAESQKYQMILEEGSWKLTLENTFRNRIDTALRGSYVH
ncbi:MAG: hypothetical protein K8S24_06295 [Candidatus Aegiribacteria sp.]|nr:hypothetical protein [Candidatus Aegiribacteria sp.]